MNKRLDHMATGYIMCTECKLNEREKSWASSQMDPKGVPDDDCMDVNCE